MKAFSFVLLFFSLLLRAQIKSDFLVADSGDTPHFEVSQSGNLHIVFVKKTEFDRSAQYLMLDSLGAIAFPSIKMSKSIHASWPTLSLGCDTAYCVWSDRVSLNMTVFSSYIKGNAVYNGVVISNELWIDDGDIIPNDAHRVFPFTKWSLDNKLIITWAGQGSSTNPYLGKSDIYTKIVALPLHRTFEQDRVINNPFIKINEYFPSIIKRSTGYWVVWTENDSTGRWRIAGKVCNDSLIPQSDKKVFVAFDTAITSVSRSVVLRKSNGSMILVWSVADSVTYENVYLREFDEHGAPSGPVIRANQRPVFKGSWINADIDQKDRVIVLWEDGDGVSLKAQRFIQGTTLLGNNFRPTTSISDGKFWDLYPVSKLYHGKIYTTWIRSVGRTSSLYMNIQDFNSPLSVDRSHPFAAKQYELYQNYPNPFNPTTTIRFKVAEPAFVTLTVYDLLGRAVSTLVNEHKETGAYSAHFAGSDLSSGMYVYRLRAGSTVLHRTMQLIK